MVLHYYGELSVVCRFSGQKVLNNWLSGIYKLQKKIKKTESKAVEVKI